jgi:hypothetical protein
MITVEDVLEVLAGISVNTVNIRIDSSDIKIIRSIAKQVHNGTALTDRQLDLALNKIERYRQGLELNKIDVDLVLEKKQTRLPLREVDRTQLISLTTYDNKPYIKVQFPFSKKLSAVWRSIVADVYAHLVEPSKNIKLLRYSESTLYTVVTNLKEYDFELSTDVAKYYNTINDIKSNPLTYIPYIDIKDDDVVVNNVSKQCEEYIESNIKDEDFLVKIDMLKNCGIYHKSPAVLQKIDKETSNDLVKNMLVNNSTRFRLKPEEYGIDTIYALIDRLKQWPLLILVDDKPEYAKEIPNMVDKVLEHCSNNEVNVFFRMDSKTEIGNQFNQYVKDNQLNGYIDNNTKVVVITKNRIPKPLISSGWKPKTAIVASSYDYGKTSAYLRNCSSVYYYNHSLGLRYSKEYRKCEIVQL